MTKILLTFLSPPRQSRIALLVDYIKAIFNIIDPEKIRFAWSIANNKICLYLSAIELVNRVVAKSISTENNNIEIKPLVQPQQRVILSNFAPEIPHSHLEDIIDNLNIRRTSLVTHLRAGSYAR